MTTLRVLPYLLSPLLIGSGSIGVKELKADEEKPRAKQNLEPPRPKGLQLDGLLKGVQGIFKLPQLKGEEKKALDEMEDFLTKHTGNGKFDYGTVNRVIIGLQHDYRAIHQEGRHMRGFAGMAARRYPNNLFRKAYYGVQEEVARRAYIELDNDLRYFGVDPNTAKTPDNAPIRTMVTRAEVERFRDNSYLIDAMSKRFLPPNKKIVFKDGITLEAIRFIKSRTLGIPPGAEIVEMPQTEKVIANTPNSTRVRCK